MSLYLAVAGGRLAMICDRIEDVAPYGSNGKFAVYEVEATLLAFAPTPIVEDDHNGDEDVEVESGE